MIKCTKPVNYRPIGGWELDNGDLAKPVIVVLDPQKVYQALIAGWFKPIPQRLEKIMLIRENRFLELPDIRNGAYSKIVFNDGQHRTTALANLGFTAYPTVTSNIDASDLLIKFGASVNEARLHFDWSEIDDYPLWEI